MTDYILSEATKAKFKQISTASVATALFKRGLRNQFIQGGRRFLKKRCAWPWMPIAIPLREISVWRWWLQMRLWQMPFARWRH